MTCALGGPFEPPIYRVSPRAGETQGQLIPSTADAEAHKTTVPASANVLDNTSGLSILHGCLAATRGESRTTEKAMTSGSMNKKCRYLLK
jgi:hypothetical protein